MDIITLQKLGLNEKEIKVYLGLLEHGAISVRGLAELIDLNRGSTYDTLKRLQEKGLVSYYHHKTKQKYVAEDPEKLVKLTQEKEDELKATKKELKKLIPELKSLHDKGEDAPVTKFYEGKEGVRFILEDILGSLENLKSDKEYFVYSATNASDDINNAYPNFTKDRIRKNIQVKAIALAEGGSTSGLDERRWLGTHNESATYILIYAGKCAFISRDKRDNPVGVIIENKMIYQTQKIIFLQLWELLNPNK
jgi:sugar-specific transcriptional regulator TrmB